MKKILIILIIILMVYLIYILFKDRKIHYTSISDGMGYDIEYKYNDYLAGYLDEKDILEKYDAISLKDSRIIDIIRAIEDNIYYGDNTYQNILIKSDILTLSIGYEDFTKNILDIEKDNLVSYTKSYLSDLDKLFKLLRKYDKENILFIGYINEYGEEYNLLFKEVNNNIKKICEQYNIVFIDLEYLDYDTLKGQRSIFNKLKTYVDTITK